jgi:hypothetical protein
VSINHEIIETRAFDLYLERDGNEGSELGDWLKAEQEILKGAGVHNKKHGIKKKKK